MDDIVFLPKLHYLFRSRLPERMDLFEKPDKAGRHNHYKDLAGRCPDIAESMRNVLGEKRHAPGFDSETLVPKLEFHLPFLHIEDFIFVAMDMQGRAAIDRRHFLDHCIPAFSLLSINLHSDCLTEDLQDPSFTRTNDALAVDIGSLHQEATHGGSGMRPAEVI